MVTFVHCSQLESDDVLPLSTYCYNITPSVDDLESPFYLVHGRGLLKEDSTIFKTIADMSETNLAD